MFSKKSVAALLVLLCSAQLIRAHSEDANFDKGVLVLTDAIFSEALSTYDPVLVEFYAPWCGHCKALEPVYVNAAKLLKDKNIPVTLAKIDATEHKEAAAQHEIQGYPTLKFFKNGKVINYEGARDENSIVNWLSKRVGPTTTVLSSVEDAERYVAGHEVTTFVAFLHGEDSTSAEAFKQVAEQIDDAKFAIVTDSNVKSHYGYGEEKDVIVAFCHFPEEPERREYDGPFDVESITDFANSQLLPLVVEFTEKTMAAIFGGKVKVHLLLFLDSLVSDDSKALINEFRTAAKDFQGKVLFVVLDTQKQETARIVSYFGVNKDLDFRLIKLANGIEKYRPETSPMSANEMKSFLNDFFEDKLSPFYLSQEPVEFSGTGVRVLVGKDHNQIVNDPSKNVFVEYYAPWCGHCKNLEPIWEKLAQEHDADEHIVIAKMDATANEIPTLAIQGFPTLKFYPAGKSDKTAVDYGGNRDFEDLKKFVKQHAQSVEGDIKSEEL